MCVASQIAHSDLSPTCLTVTINIEIHGLHHTMVRTRSLEKSKHFILDTFIAVGEGRGTTGHSHTELFTLSSLKWQIKEDYPYSSRETKKADMEIGFYSILAVEKKFIIFGGHYWLKNDMRVLTTFRFEQF